MLLILKRKRKMNEKDSGGMYVMYHTALHLYLLAISVFKGYFNEDQTNTNQCANVMARASMAENASVSPRTTKT